MKSVAYTCPYVPAELIAAHGLHPARLMLSAGQSDGRMTPAEGVCPFVRRFIDQVPLYPQACAVVVTTVCDQMRRAFDILVSKTGIPAFLLNVPATVGSAAEQLYLSELHRFDNFLASLSGRSPTKAELADVIRRHSEKRTSLLQSRKQLSSLFFFQAVAEFNRTAFFNVSREAVGRSLNNAIPLAFLGGPLLEEDSELFNIIENLGAKIVLDATETGERGLPTMPNGHLSYTNPMAFLAANYINSIADPARRPNNFFYDWLMTKLTERRVRGIILRRYIWCDIWHAEVARIKKITNLPCLDLDIDSTGAAQLHRIKERITAFLEMFD